MNRKKNVLLVTGGSVDMKLLRDYYDSNNDLYVVGVDKGLESLDKALIKPDLVIGDFDSACDSIRTIYASSAGAIVLNTEKDYSDTHAAIVEVLKLNPEHITIIGGTGTRIDHMLGTIGLLKFCLKNGVKAEVIDNNNRIRIIDKEITITKKSQYGKYVSCVAFSDIVEGLTIKGFKYDVFDMTLTNDDTIGVSNELREEEGLISIKKGYLLVFETKD